MSIFKNFVLSHLLEGFVKKLIFALLFPCSSEKMKEPIVVALPPIDGTGKVFEIELTLDCCVACDSRVHVLSSLRITDIIMIVLLQNGFICVIIYKLVIEYYIFKNNFLFFN